MNKNRMFGLLAIALCFTAGCGSVLDFDSLVWIDPIDGGTDGSIPDSGTPDSGLPDSGDPDAGPDAGADGGAPDGGWDGGLNPCIPNPCTAPNKGICNPTGVTTFSCSCNAGYHDDSGNCVMDQTCQGNSCGGHGQCTTPGGVVTCSCELGYEPLYCGTCSTNWQDNDSNGTCLMACSNPSLVLNCNGHGNCSDTTGTAICACFFKWSGADCNACAAGNYIFSGNCVDDPCLPNPCLNGGSCANGTGSVVCTCAGNRDPATNCSACLAGYGGANCDPMATLTVTPQSGAVTTLFASDLQVLKWRVACSGGNCAIPKQTVSYQFSGGSWTVTGQTLYKNSVASTATLTRFGGVIVIVSDTSEDAVSSGAFNDYLLYLTIGGSGSSGNTLTVTLLGDSTPTASMDGGTGYIYNMAGSRLYTSASGLCSAGPPNLVWSGLPHTAPSPVCSISSYGTPDYSTGFQVAPFTVSNTLTAP